jgi:GFO/IDH/MocA oxidoreductase family protein
MEPILGEREREGVFGRTPVASIGSPERWRISVDRVGIAFIGVGIVAEMHGRRVSATPAANLVGVYDSAESKAREIARKFGGRVFKSLEDALANPKLHAVHTYASHAPRTHCRSKSSGRQACPGRKARGMEIRGDREASIRRPQIKPRVHADP